MKLEFTKMQGLGNDFVLINAMDRPVSLTPAQIRHMADRHSGIGFDQLLLLAPSTIPSADVMYRVFNADGSEGGQSGNGARCIGRYIRENSIVGKDVISAQTIKGIIHIYFEGENAIRVDMGVPRFEPKDIPMASRQRQPSYSVELVGGNIEVFCLSMGNPHAVIMVDDIDSADVEMLGKQLQQHSLFPESVNVGFLQIVDRTHVLLRVYERGAGETLACGTGACAAVVAGICDNKLDKEVVVGLKRGNLVISWEGENSVVWMTGPAVTVFEGHMTL
jgi:diaminopimelate epimerase